MIDPSAPDYTNTPASESRPTFNYAARDYTTPLLSVITPYYNTGPVIWETVRAVQRMSFAHWEWIILDDGSTDPASVAQLERIEQSDTRIRVVHQPNGGPAVARNRAAAEARGTYLLQLDSDDLVEPTFAEKALWVLETQPQFAACSSYTVTFGDHSLLWPAGFQQYEINLRDNKVTNQAVIRREAFLACGGYDESITRGHEDWDFWLNLADAGFWGYTIPEYLTWYRWNTVSRRGQTSSNEADLKAFHRWLNAKHRRLTGNFPHPVWLPNLELSNASVSPHVPLDNRLSKPNGVTRVLLVVPWLALGGADKFNLDILQLLTQRDFEFTIATTRPSDHKWLHEFAQLTPDIFCLDRFLHYVDYPRFLSYLIRSRQIDAVLLANSELGYALVPYLRAHHPDVALLDYTHSEVENWKNGGYPGMAVRVGRQLDLNVTSTQYLKRWMVNRGADPERIHVCHYGTDTNDWQKEHFDTDATRLSMTIPPHVPIVLFAGRFSFEKRPLLFAKIMQCVAELEPSFVALMAGSGDEMRSVESFVRRHRLEQHIRLLGALPNTKIQALMAAADILVVPSEIEGMAIVLLEAMAMETVPVAVDIAGHPELVTPECGYLIPRSDKELDLYADAVLRLIRNPDLRHEMARQGRQRIAEHFALRDVGERMDGVIRLACDLVRERPAHGGDLEVADYATQIAVENMRLEELADALWAQRAQSVPVGLVRRAREAVLPIGTQRYEMYKRLRQGLRRVRSRLAMRRQPGTESERSSAAAVRARPAPLVQMAGPERSIEGNAVVLSLNNSGGLPTPEEREWPENITLTVAASVGAEASAEAGDGDGGIQGEKGIEPDGDPSSPTEPAAAEEPADEPKAAALAYFDIWQQALPSGVSFWEHWIQDEEGSAAERDRRARLDPTTPLQDWVRGFLNAPEGSAVQVLDVGAGPATQVGKLWPGRQVEITAVDPLAQEYDRLWHEQGVTPPVRTQPGEGEHLLARFAPDTFDFACAIDALDHGYDPLSAIQEMLAVVKPGHWIFLQHYVDDAQRAKYQGLHQWNFTAEAGQFVIWNRQRRIFVGGALPLAAEVRVEVLTDPPRDMLRVLIRKRERPADEPLLSQFVPRAALVVPETTIAQPRYAVIDAHNHLGELIPGLSFSGTWATRPVAELVEELDAASVSAVVDLDGGYGDTLLRELARYGEPYPDRFIVFAGVEYEAFAREHDVGQYLARQLRASASRGARGLKIWKLLGLHLRDASGRLYRVDDQRLDELWATAADLGLPVLIHVADPVAFFQPLDMFNERFEELTVRPDWHYGADGFPGFDELMEQFESLVRRHRETTFIGSHVGCYAENLGWVGRMLDAYPNFHVDIGGRLNELGRQPYRARDFFLRYADRIVFGTDSPPDRRVYQLYYRFLETQDEYFSYAVEPIPSEGRWSIYGISLPDDVLRRVYRDNAARLLKIGVSSVTP